MTTKYNLIRDVSGAVTQNVLPSDTIIHINVKNLQEHFDIPSDKSSYVVIFKYTSNTSDSGANKILVEARNYPYPPQSEARKESPLAFSVPGGSRIYLTPARNGVDTNVLVEANIYEASETSSQFSVRAESALQSIYIEAAGNTTGVVDDSLYFKAWGVFSDGTTQQITNECNWIVADTYIAQFSSPGDCVLLHSGQTDIQAEHIATGLRSNFITINVYAISYINVLPQNPTAAVGQNVTFAAIAYYTDGTSGTIIPDSWESSDLSKATITNYGVATAISHGTANIFCVSRGVASNISVLTISAVSYIRLIPDAVNMGIGQNQSFMAVAYYTNGTSGTIIPDEWISMYPAIATINSQGVATAVSVGITAITARLGTVISVQAPITVVAISYVTIIPTNPAIDVGKTVGFTAIAYYTNDTSSTVVAEQWISSDHLIATIDAQGIATGVSAGTSIISCVYKGFNSLTQILEVIGQRLVIELLTYPSNPTGSVNSHVLFQAYATYYGGDKAVIVPTYWYSSNPSIATIDENGDAYLHNIGLTNIYCQVNNPDGTIIISNEQPLTVIQIYIEQLEITPSPSVTQRIGSSIQFNGYGVYSDGSRRPLVPLNWYTDNEDVVSIGLNGYVLLLTYGVANIYASEPGYQGVNVISNTVVVTSLEVMSLDVNPVDPSSKVGQSIEFNAFATYNDNSVERIDPSHWNSDNQVVATIDKDGYASCLSVGTSNITATLHQYNVADITSYPQALVVDANDEVISLDITPKNPVITEGGYAQFYAIATYADGSKGAVIPDDWISSDPTIFTIDANGYAKGLILGVATVVASLDNVFKKRDVEPRAIQSPSTNVTVGYDYISSLEITPSFGNTGVNVPLRNVTQFNCMAIFTDGSKWTIAPTRWLSSDESIATVDANGCVTGIIVGTTTIRAYVEQPDGPTIISPFVKIVVTTGSKYDGIVSIEASPSSIVISKDNSGYMSVQQMICIASYSNGTKNYVNPTRWQVLTQTDMTINLNTTTGSVTANGNGTGKIMAYIEQPGLTTISSNSVVVRASSEPTLYSISLSPAIVNILVGQSCKLVPIGNYSVGKKYMIPDRWGTSNAGIIDYDADGGFVGASEGATAIYAYVDLWSGTISSNPVIVNVSNGSYVAVGNYIFDERATLPGYLPCTGYTFCASNPLYMSLAGYLKSIGTNNVPKYGYGDGAIATIDDANPSIFHTNNNISGTPFGTTKFSPILPSSFYVITIPSTGACLIGVGSVAELVAKPKAYLQYYTKNKEWYLIFNINGVIQRSTDIPLGATNIGVVKILSTYTSQQLRDCFVAAMNPLCMSTPNFGGYHIRVTDNGSGIDPDAATRLYYDGTTGGDKPGTFQQSQNIMHNHEVDRLDISGKISGDWSGQTTPQFTFRDGSAVDVAPNVQWSLTTYIGDEGGAEARGKNVTLNMFIKY